MFITKLIKKKNQSENFSTLFLSNRYFIRRYFKCRILWYLGFRALSAMLYLSSTIRYFVIFFSHDFQMSLSSEKLDLSFRKGLRKYFWITIMVIKSEALYSCNQSDLSSQEPSDWPWSLHGRVSVSQNTSFFKIGCPCILLIHLPFSYVIYLYSI